MTPYTLYMDKQASIIRSKLLGGLTLTKEENAFAGRVGDRLLRRRMSQAGYGGMILSPQPTELPRGEFSFGVNVRPGTDPHNSGHVTGSIKADPRLGDLQGHVEMVHGEHLRHPDVPKDFTRAAGGALQQTMKDFGVPRITATMANERFGSILQKRQGWQPEPGQSDAFLERFHGTPDTPAIARDRARGLAMQQGQVPIPSAAPRPLLPSGTH